MKLIRERYLATQPHDDDGGEQSDTTMYSSQTETEYTTRTDTEGESMGKSARIRAERDFPNVVDMLALCYMACMVLRIPLSVGTLYR